MAEDLNHVTSEPLRMHELNSSINVRNVTFTSDALIDNPTIWTSTVIQRVTTLLCIIVFSVFGNAVIISFLSCSMYRKRSRVNMFIINLAIGDLAVCAVTMTTEILFVVFGEWVLGAVGCKLLTYLQIVTLSSTTFILTSMAYDRYDAICTPLRYRASVCRARKFVMVSWLLAFVFAVPQLLIFQQTEEGLSPDGHVRHGCRSHGYTADWQRKLYLSFMATCILVLPGIFISFCYINVARVVWGQGRKMLKEKGQRGALRMSYSNKWSSSMSKAKLRTIKMTLAIIVLFLTCWTPYFVTTLIKVYTDYQFAIPPSVMVFSETMALLQSAVNPILYGCFNLRFKKGMHRNIFRQSRHELASTTSLRTGSRRLTDIVSFNGETNNLRMIDNGTSLSNGSSPAITRRHSCLASESNRNSYKFKIQFSANRKISYRLSRGDSSFDSNKITDTVSTQKSPFESVL